MNRVELKGARYYETPAGRFPSVTTVLQVVAKPALIPWARNVALEKVRETLLERLSLYDGVPRDSEGTYGGWVAEVIELARKRPDEVKEIAADFGSRAHQMLSDFIKEGMAEVPAELETVMQNFLAWKEQSGLSLEISEQTVYSATHGYAGTLDITARTAEGNLAVVDLKTSNGLWPEFRLQVAAYAAALEESARLPAGGEPVLQCWVVRLGKNKPEFEVVASQNWREDFRAFLAVLELWKWFHKKES